MSKVEVDSAVLVEVINGFIRSMLSGLETMAFTKASRVGVYVRKDGQAMQGELSTLISVFGDLSGTCSISFPKKLATKLISSMMMDDSIDDVNSDVIDGIGEITNLTAGGAKAELFKVLGTKASISTPTVIAGAKHSVNHRPDVPCIGCVFEAEGMRFALEVAVYPDK